MLLSLRIDNFALIDHLELEFGQGLNVLTGEPGAGKSIILDAVDVALAGKITGKVIRTGSDRSLKANLPSTQWWRNGCENRKSIPSMANGWWRVEK